MLSVIVGQVWGFATGLVVFRALRRDDLL
jgi:hypothetical protein